MEKHYTHLSAEDSGLIMAERLRWTSGAEIARMLGRSPSTISRELKRNASCSSTYNASEAGSAYRERRCACGRSFKLVEGSWLYNYVHCTLIYQQWLPQQISTKLRSMYQDDITKTVSHETIYAAIYAHPRVSLADEGYDRLFTSG